MNFSFCSHHFKVRKFITSAKLALEHWHMLFFTENSARAGFITVNEMETAESEILKNVQLHHFPEEMKSLSKPTCQARVRKSSCLWSLDPILVDGLLRIGGRLSLASTPFDAKHQIILPKNDHVTDIRTGKSSWS